MHKISSKTVRYIKAFTSKIICNNVDLLFAVIFIIYLQSAKYFLQMEHHIEWLVHL